VSRWTRGVVTSGVLTGCSLLVGCSAPVEIDPPELGAADQAACEAFADELPDTLAGEQPVDTDPEDPLGGAYGDPAIAVVCGVGVPEEFGAGGQCEEADGVGWFAPPEQYDDQSADVTIFAVTHRPVVELRVPGDYRPNGLAAALTDVSAPVKQALERVDDCF
jgi:hypothetical protein